MKPEKFPELHKLLLFVFWVFDKAPPKFISHSEPVDQQFDSSVTASKVQDKDDTSRKRMRATNDSEALAKVVALLAPSEQEQKEKLQFLKDQKIHEKCEEKRKKFSWKRSECEKFLSSNVPLADGTK